MQKSAKASAGGTGRATSSGAARPATRRPAAKQAPAKQGASKKAAAKKAPAKRPAANAPVKKAPAKKAAPRNAAGTRKAATLPGPRPEARATTRKPLPKPERSSARFTELVSGSVPVVNATTPAPKASKPVTPPTGTPRSAAGRRGPAKPVNFRERFGVPYNTQGPRMRIGVAWLLVVIASLAYEPLRPYGLATVYAVAAGLAAMQVVDAWHDHRVGGDRTIAAFGASLLPVAATIGTRWLGAGILALVSAALVSALARSPERRDMPPLAAAGHTVFAAACCGGAAASLVLLANYEIGAVIILIVYLMVYDASDYIVGSGSSNNIEGPIAGGLFVCATTMFLAVIEVPPFRGVDIWNFAALAIVALPAGQFLASAMLPKADVHAPALRRIDSLLVVAPAWAIFIGIYLQQSGH